MKDLLEYEIPVTERQVVVVHILINGEVILNPKELSNFKDRFVWVDSNNLTNLLEELRPQTDSNRKSIIAIFESGEIRTYANVSNNFTNYNLLNKSGI